MHLHRFLSTCVSMTLCTIRIRIVHKRAVPILIGFIFTTFTLVLPSRRRMRIRLHVLVRLL